MEKKPTFRVPEELQRSWRDSQRPLPRLVVRPLERFLAREAGSASLLMLAAVAALVWANVAEGSYAAGRLPSPSISVASSFGRTSATSSTTC